MKQALKIIFTRTFLNFTLIEFNFLKFDTKILKLLSESRKSVKLLTCQLSEE